MQVRLVLAAALSASALRSRGPQPAAKAPPRSRRAARPVAAYPKGHYAALNSLPDWGGVWVLNSIGRARRSPPNTPALRAST